MIYSIDGSSQSFTYDFTYFEGGTECGIADVTYTAVTYEDGSALDMTTSPIKWDGA